MYNHYLSNTKRVLAHFKTSVSGLSEGDMALRQKEFGANALTETKQKSKWLIVLAQFTDVMIIILIIAAVISFVSSERTEAFVILAIIIGNAWMGFSQEYNTEKSIHLLQKMAPQFAMVLFDNNPVKTESNKFVPRDQHNMVFKGTIVSNGSAKAVVTAIGMNTELGKIVGLLKLPSQKTPLQKRLTVFSKQLALIVILICLAVFAEGLWRGAAAFQMFPKAISLAVAALPEALPAVITIALAMGASRMVKPKALMRKLPAVETLGSVTYISCDKTGTIKMMQIFNRHNYVL